MFLSPRMIVILVRVARLPSSCERDDSRRFSFCGFGLNGADEAGRLWCWKDNPAVGRGHRGLRLDLDLVYCEEYCNLRVGFNNAALAMLFQVFEMAPTLYMVEVRKAMGDTLDYHTVKTCFINTWFQLLQSFELFEVDARASDFCLFIIQNRGS